MAVQGAIVIVVPEKGTSSKSSMGLRDNNVEDMEHLDHLDNVQNVTAPKLVCE